MKDKEVLYADFKKFYDTEIERRERIKEKYPDDVPNNVCNHAFIRGYSLENSFSPKKGDYNYLCQIGFETLYIWTYKNKKDINSTLVSETNLAVKELPYWKTAANLIWLSLSFVQCFEGATMENIPDYKWMYYFDPSTSTIENTVFYNFSSIEQMFISTGTHLKLTQIASLAPVIELLIRDDQAYSALSLVHSAFCIHSCCLICEMSEHPWHDHLTEEPSIWEQAQMLPNLEIAIVQSCRAVEAIIGQPPSQKKPGKVLAHKQHWKNIVGIDPDTLFKKANMSYWDFYYKLFFKLRNPSAHSYGNIHYNLARKRAVEAQCFAAVIIQKYINKHTADNESSIDSLKFNKGLLDKVSEIMLLV